MLTRTAEPDELSDAVRRLAAGERVLAAAAVLTGWVETGAAVEFAQDKSNREIARSMVVSESTVKSHLSHLYRKLGVSSRREAVRRGLERGLLT